MDEGTRCANDAPRTWGQDESKVFVEYGWAMMPGREQIERTLLDLLPAEPDEPFSGVEIGIGAGWLSASVLREFPKGRRLRSRAHPARHTEMILPGNVGINGRGPRW